MTSPSHTASLDCALSVVIPARNEAGSLPSLVATLTSLLQREQIAYELLIINDSSTDDTAAVMSTLSTNFCNVHCYVPLGRGYGAAIRHGIQTAKGSAVIVTMADSSDSPTDLVRFFRLYQQGFDCVFGTRFSAGGRVVNYPLGKLLVNRAVNLICGVLLAGGYNDLTNAFKLYSRASLQQLPPLRSLGFALNLELPLSAIEHGLSYAVVPNHWQERRLGRSHFALARQAPSYLWVLLIAIGRRIIRRARRKPR